MKHANRSSRVRFWLLGLIAILAIGQAGCYCADWRWIWEHDDDYCVCH
jgi:hypothetical protein